MNEATSNQQEPSSMRLMALINHCRLIVCCGAGGVGKTTTSAALALTAARLGKRVLALTIDPSKRLAQTLGVAKNSVEPVLLDRSRLTELGVPESGELYAWLLDPQMISDRVVNEEAGDQAEALKNNLIYKQISGIVAGMQEYTAVEALHQFLKTDRFDLIVLDTPPARHALRFIDSPERVASFLDKRIFRLFVPGKTGLIGKVASKVIDEVLERAFGEVTSKELKQFFELFSRLLAHLNQNQTEMADIFRGDDVAFFLVTTAREDALVEAQLFAREVLNRQLQLGGFFLNRCPNTQAETVTLDQLSDRCRKLIFDVLKDDEATVKLFDTLREPLLTTHRGHKLRLETSEKLKHLGQTFMLGELDTDASSLAGINQLATALIKEASTREEGAI
jgi:anion-transporting  ArsA/GET3 family ATPase